MTRARTPTRTHALIAAALVALATLVAAAAGARPALASPGQESIFQDDKQLEFSGAAKRDLNLDRLQALGVDTIRVLVFWDRTAPGAQSITKPAGFDGSNPADYPAGNWDRYDELIRGARARGMKVILNPNGPGPRWAAGKNGDRIVVKPNADEFRQFIEALGKRYSGTYTDESGGILPRVSDWSIWNEGNIGGWLQPQWKTVKVGRRKQRIPMSPHIYRKLYVAGQTGLRNTGHGSDRLLIGELAPRGGSGKNATGQMDPGIFVRELFCVDKRFKKLRGSAAKARGCNGYRKLTATGFAMHPYVIGITPTSTPRNRDEFPIGNTRTLQKLLDRAAARGRVNRLDLYFTEFGVQSNPPDRYVGVPLATMADYMNVAEYLAYRNPRVRAWAQYQMNDDPLLTQFGPTNPRRYGSFQTGLRFVDDRIKPAYDAYRLPIAVNRLGSSKVEVFGGLRPAPNGTTQHAVVEFAHSAGGTFSAIASVTVTNPRGYFTLQKTVAGAGSGRFRIRWQAGDGTTYFSRSAAARKIKKALSR